MNDLQIDTLRALSVKDGDVLVLKTLHPLTQIEAARIKQTVRGLSASLGKSVLALIVDPDIDVDLITDDRAKRIQAILDEVGP